MGDRVAALVADEKAVTSRGAELRAAGWRVQCGWALPNEPWDQSDRRIACWGTVKNEDDVSAAVLAGARGAVVLAVSRAPAWLVTRLVDDLARLGAVDHPVAATSLVGGPDNDQRALLDLLAGGATVAEAAQERHLSIRSAERRLASARAALGVRSTAEAVSRLRAQIVRHNATEVQP